MKYFFDLAAKAAVPPHLDNDPRGFLLGAVGLRRDGKLVSTKNGAVHATDTNNYRPIAWSHAESRLCRKLGRGGIVYVARIARKDRSLVMARPCGTCERILKAYATEKVFYSINSEYYGIWNLISDRDEVFKF